MQKLQTHADSAHKQGWSSWYLSADSWYGCGGVTVFTLFVQDVLKQGPENVYKVQELGSELCFILTLSSL